MEGFELLSESQMLEVLNFSDNIFPLGKSANSSKGAKVSFVWDKHISRALDVDPQYRRLMIEKSVELEAKLQKMIDDFLL